MLQPPPIPDTTIRDCLSNAFGLRGCALEFLPLGADLGSAVYRATARAGEPYFVKLKFGPFDELAVLLSAWLRAQGISQIIAPLSASSGRPFAVTPDFTMLVYPFVEGHDAYAGELSDAQWAAFGGAVRQYQGARLPDDLARRLPRERYDPRWRDALREAMTRLDINVYKERIARRFAEFMAERRDRVLELVAMTDRLAGALQEAALPGVLCHTDLHPGNLLMCPDGRLFIVDWDAPLLAPRERDLMYPGGAQGFPGRSPAEEEARFFAGYGAVAVDLRSVAYYRLARVIEDLAIFCDQLLDLQARDGAGSSDAEREQALGWAMSNFLPGHTLEIAEQTERRSRTG